MIVTEFLETRFDGVNLYRTVSDQNLMIRQETGALYEEAIDVENSGHTYTETDIPIPEPEPEPEVPPEFRPIIAENPENNIL